MTTEKLNAKQRAFVFEYLKDRNATQAAIRAGYTAKNADVVGPRLLGNVGVQAAIAEQTQAVEAKSLVTSEWVVMALKEVAERCMERVPVMVGRADDRQQATEQVPCDCEDPNCKGVRTVGVWEFDSSGANRALELLGKHKGLFVADQAGDKGGVDTLAQTIRDVLAEARKHQVIVPVVPSPPGSRENPEYPS
jgi:phage terminase small subunit